MMLISTTLLGEAGFLLSLIVSDSLFIVTCRTLFIVLLHLGLL